MNFTKKAFSLCLMVGIMISVPNLMFSQTLGSITGKYTDSSGNTLGYSSVTLYDANKRMVTTAVTQADGVFTFSGLQSGTYYLQFSKSGAPDVWYGGGNGQTVTVSNSNVTVNFQYPQGLNIAGKYTDSNGSALGYNSVTLYDANRRMITTTVTKTDGTFTFSGLQSGTFYLQFSKSGAPDVWHGGGNGQAVSVGNSNVTVNFQYPASAGITGKYTDSNGSALGYNSVTLYDANRRMVTTTVTKTDGTFTFSGLQSGTYYLQFSKSGAPDVWHGGGNGQAVSVGNSNVTVNFQYPASAGITGKYTDSNGSALGYNSVTLFDANKKMVTTTVTKTDGIFTFSGLQSGTFYLQFSKSGAPDVWYGGGNGQALTIGNSNVTANFQYPK